MKRIILCYLALGCATCLAAAAASQPPAEAWNEESLARHLQSLRPRVPEGFSIVLEKPFVVMGDDEPQRVRQFAQGTVRWATLMLRKEYFSRDPERIIDIWLFQNAQSYTRHTRAIFAMDTSSPYGFYSPEHDALIMNIATGGGTLVHEMVHAFMSANFPQCPAWLNEGLGSLYEQSAQKNGRIVGLTNWRLAGLQEAIRDNTVPSFEALTATTPSQFYGQNRGTYYAQARYLCYYLQEQGRLKQFFHDFRANRGQDPSGYKTLMALLDEKDMAAFQQRWQNWVLKLTFPE